MSFFYFSKKQLRLISPIWRRSRCSGSMSRLVRLFVLFASNLGGVWVTDDLCQNRSSAAQRGRSEEYLPLRYATMKSSLVTYPCDTDRSIWIRGGFFYQFNREELLWKQLCIPAKLFPHQVMSPKRRGKMRRWQTAFRYLWWRQLRIWKIS